MFRARTPSTGLATLVPACMAAIAYVDPGNFGVNVEAGAKHGYTLVWVVVAASIMASLVQYLAAKLGIATGLSLAENCRARLPRRARLLLWAQAELVVMMTDLAEVVGGALALNLLFGVALVPGAAIVAGFGVAVLVVRVRGYDGFAPILVALFGIIVGSLLYQSIAGGVDVARLARGALPGPVSQSGALLAVGIIGATVMPHALHFHSAVSRTHPTRPARERSGMAALGRQSGLRAAKSSRSAARSVALAMALAGLANVAIVLIAARLPKGTADGLPAVFDSLGEVAGRSAALLFGVALLMSGLASTVVGVYTGQIVMEGFLGRSVPMVLRRGVAVVPAMAILVAGMDATRALVLSQVVLSFALPATLIPLLMFTRDPSIMGRLVNRRRTSFLAAAATCLVVTLDAFLLWNLLAP